MPIENNVCRIVDGNKILISEWWSNGVMSYRRDTLPTDHPESTYSCIARLGLVPEDFGIFPRVEP